MKRPASGQTTGDASCSLASQLLPRQRASLADDDISYRASSSLARTSVTARIWAISDETVLAWDSTSGSPWHGDCITRQNLAVLCTVEPRPWHTSGSGTGCLRAWSREQSFSSGSKDSTGPAHQRTRRSSGISTLASQGMKPSRFSVRGRLVSDRSVRRSLIRWCNSTKRRPDAKGLQRRYSGFRLARRTPQ